VIKRKRIMERRSLAMMCICAFTLLLMAVVWPFVAIENPLFFGWMPSMLAFHFVVFSIWVVSWGVYLFSKPKKRQGETK